MSCCDISFPNELDKSGGYAFTVNAPFLDGSVDFYRGLYSPGSYAAMYRDKLIYLSGILCRFSTRGREGYAKFKLFEYFHYKEK